MVDIGGLSVKIEVDTREIDVATQKLDKVDKRIMLTRERLKTMMSEAVRTSGFVSMMVAQTLNVAVTIYEMIMGESNPILKFLLQMAISAVTIIYAIAMAVSSTGYGTYIAAGLAIVGATLQIVASAYIQTQQEMMSIQAVQMSQVFSQMSQLFNF